MGNQWAIICLLAAVLALLSGLLVLTWRLTDSKREVQIGMFWIVLGLAFLVLAGLSWISTTLFLIGVVCAIVVVLVAVRKLLLE